MSGKLSEAEVDACVRLLRSGSEEFGNAMRDHIDALTAENERLKQACAKQNNEICETLGKALGYPDDPQYGRIIGEHIAETLAVEAAERIQGLITENERLRQRLLTAAGDDLCRLTQEEIKDLTGGKVPIPPKGEFLASCERFHAQIAGEDGVNQNCLTLAQLVADNERLTNELSETKIALEFASATREQADHEIEILQRQAASADQGTAAANIGGSETGVEASQTIGECPECHYSAWVISAETGRVLFCKVCDEMSQKRDALQMERELKAELAAAQQRLAALAVDPTKREELGRLYLEAYNDWAMTHGTHPQQYPLKWEAQGSATQDREAFIASRCFHAGRLSRDAEVAALEKQLADCARQFAGFRSQGTPLEICTWAANYICDLEDDRLRLGKQLVEIRGGDGGSYEVAKKVHSIAVERHPGNSRCWAVLTRYERETVVQMVDAVAAPLRLRIAELEKKVQGQFEQIGNHGRCITRIKTNNQRLAAELSTTKQALADARGELNSLQSSVRKIGLAGEIVGKECEACKKAVTGIMFPNGAVLLEEHDCVHPAPANPAASEPAPVLITRLAYPQSNYKQPSGVTIVRGGEPTEDLKFQKEFAQRMAEMTTAKSKASDPAERRFVCPRCGCTELASDGDHATAVKEPIVCGRSRCRWTGTWAEVEAAESEGEQVSPAVKKALGAYHAGRQVVERNETLEQQLAAANQAREAERQNLKATAELLGIVSAEAKELSQRAEAAEAVIAAIRAIRTPPCITEVEQLEQIDQALAADPGRAANELRSYKKFFHKCKGALAADEAFTDHSTLAACLKDFIAELDQALAQGEQRGEVR